MSKNIALACRGGGIKSASSIGVIKALEEMDYTISRISGTGFGSIVAALYAVGFSPDDILNHLSENIVAYCNAARFVTSNGDGNLEILETSIDKATGGKTFKDCNISLKITASKGNFLFHKPIIFSAETFPDLTLGKACRASSSFPFLYQKFHMVYDEKRYKLLDGGITLNPLVEKNENEVSILSTFFNNKDKKENTHSFYASAWHQAESKADIVIKPTLPLGTFGNEENLHFAFKRGFRKTNQMISLIANKAE